MKQRSRRLLPDDASALTRGGLALDLAPERPQAILPAMNSSARSMWVLGCAFAILACGGPPAPGPQPVLQSGTPGNCKHGRAFVILRHAEKASADKDPSLSDRGRARARAVATMFAHAGVTRLVASSFKRTQETLAPLAEQLSLPVEVRPADKVAELAAELRSSPDGAVVVVASHSNVVPRLTRELGGGVKLRGVEGDALSDDDYARVYVITASCLDGREAAPYVMELSSGDS
jgi:phosphohistidine phosphatase SixA